jgi:hypothetical protein
VNSECFETVFEAVIVGAGFGGIGAATQLKRLGYENFVILDREADLGGTWHVNRYPGLAVDIPCTTYSYWFEPDPNWSRLFAPGAELKRYAEHVADNYDVRRRMRFNQIVESARWDEDTHVWQVALAGGQILTTRLLITATGFLSQPRTPDISGLDSFDGRVMHTAAWDDSYCFAGRRVGLIGTGGERQGRKLGKWWRENRFQVYQGVSVQVQQVRDYFNPSGEATLLRRRPHETRCGKPRPSRCATTRSPHAAAPSRQYRPDELGA